MKLNRLIRVLKTGLARLKRLRLKVVSYLLVRGYINFILGWTGNTARLALKRAKLFMPATNPGRVYSRLSAGMGVQDPGGLIPRPVANCTGSDISEPALRNAPNFEDVRGDSGLLARFLMGYSSG